MIALRYPHQGEGLKESQPERAPSMPGATVRTHRSTRNTFLYQDNVSPLRIIRFVHFSNAFRKQAHLRNFKQRRWREVCGNHGLTVYSARP